MIRVHVIRFAGRVETHTIQRPAIWYWRNWEGDGPKGAYFDLVGGAWGQLVYRERARGEAP